MLNSCLLRESSPESEGVVQFSKWLSLQLLLDAQEMRALLSLLGDFEIFSVSEVVSAASMQLSQEEFLNSYGEYVAVLQRGEIPEPRRYARAFSAVWTQSREALYAMAVGAERWLVKAVQPVIQLQAHQLSYSPEDGLFRPMIRGREAISWGIQFSYPQLLHCPQSGEVLSTKEFSNTALFKAVQQWVRDQTIPTPFSVAGKRINVPMRLGRACLAWINAHAQLRQREIAVLQL